MTHPSCSVNAHIVSSKAAVKILKTFLKSSSLYNQHSELLQIIPIATLASLLIDIVDCTEKIAEFTYDLATLARFKVANESNNLEEKPIRSNINQLDHQGVNQVSQVDCPQIVISVAELTLMTSKSVDHQGNTMVANSDGQHSLED